MSNFTTILKITTYANCERQIQRVLEDKLIKNSPITGKILRHFKTHLVL